MAGAAADRENPAKPSFQGRLARSLQVIATDIHRLQDEGQVDVAIDTDMAACVLLACWEGLQFQWQHGPEFDIRAPLSGSSVPQLYEKLQARARFPGLISLDGTPGPGSSPPPGLLPRVFLPIVLDGSGARFCGDISTFAAPRPRQLTNALQRHTCLPQEGFVHHPTFKGENPVVLL